MTFTIGLRGSFSLCSHPLQHGLPLCGHDQAGFSEDQTPSAEEVLVWGEKSTAPDFNTGSQTAVTS